VRDTHVAFGGHEARAQRHLLLPALHAVQSRVGWVSEGALNYICKRLTVPPADAWGVATFYALLSTTPRPRRVLHVCDDIACKCRGADELIAELEAKVGPEHHPPSDRTHVHVGEFAWVRSPCLGMCDHAPAMMIQEFGVTPRERAIGQATVADAVILSEAKDLRERTADPSAASQPQDDTMLLRRVGNVDP